MFIVFVVYRSVMFMELVLIYLMNIYGVERFPLRSTHIGELVRLIFFVCLVFKMVLNRNLLFITVLGLSSLNWVLVFEPMIQIDQNPT